jgi:hypothetical protein
MDSEAKRNHVEQLFNELSKEIEGYENEARMLREENDEIVGSIEAQSKIIKSYELLWAEIAQKIREMGLPEDDVDQQILEDLEIPEVLPTKFEDDTERGIFLSRVCNFENVVKKILDYVPKLMRERDELENKNSEKDLEMAHLEDAVTRLGMEMDALMGAQTPLRQKLRSARFQKSNGRVASRVYGMDSRRLEIGPLSQTRKTSTMVPEEKYKKALSDLKIVFNECLQIFQNLLDDPKNVKELYEVVSNQIDTKLAIELEEEELIEKELAVREENVSKLPNFKRMTKIEKTPIQR